MTGRTARLLPILLTALLAHSAGAANLAWDGTLRLIVTDDVTATYHGAVVDVTPFAGAYVYGDTCSGSCIVEPFPPDATNYVFPDGLGVLAGLGITTFGVESSVEIEDEHIVDADEAALLALLGYTVSEGEIIDVWTVGSETAGAALLWEAAFIYVSTNPFSSTAFTPTPPPSPDLVIFEIDEGDGAIYQVFGDVSTVPEPGGSALLGAGVLGLGFLARRRARKP